MDAIGESSTNDTLAAILNGRTACVNFIRATGRWHAAVRPLVLDGEQEPARVGSGRTVEAAILDALVGS